MEKSWICIEQLPLSSLNSMRALLFGPVLTKELFLISVVSSIGTPFTKTLFPEAYNMPMSSPAFFVI
jgi:hypothetical protein